MNIWRTLLVFFLHSMNERDTCVTEDDGAGEVGCDRKPSGGKASLHCQSGICLFSFACL